MKCRFCRKEFKETQDGTRYKNFCSHNCYFKFWKEDPKNRKKANSYLCPNHHRLYDQKLFTKKELKKIKPVMEILQS